MKKLFILIICFMNAFIFAKDLIENEKFQDSKLNCDINSDLYKSALIQIAKNNKEQAYKIIGSIKNSSPIAVNCHWKDPKPQNIDDFFDKLFLDYIYDQPQYLSYLSLFESIGIYDHNAFLDDISINTMKQNLEKAKKHSQILQKYQVKNLSEKQKLSYKIFKYMLQETLRGERFLFHQYMINQMDGILFMLDKTFTMMHKLDNAENIDNYILRLEKIPNYFRQVVELLEYQRKNNIMLPRFALEGIIYNIKNFIRMLPVKNTFYTHFKMSIEKMEIADRDAKLKAVEVLMEKKVYPSYRMLQEYFEKILKTTKFSHGVWALPNGDEYYKYMLKQHTTTNLTVGQIHQLGLAEVSKILKEMRDVLAKEGIVNPKKSIAELINDFSYKTQVYYPNSEEGRQQCLSDLNDILKRSKEKLSHLFDIRPKASIKIRPVPKHEENGAPMAYYIPASMDGSRKGTFFINLRNMNEVNKYELETLFVHEAEPGHHFQTSIQNEMDLPILRKLMLYTAYVEGWALYIEKLAYEQDFYSSSFDKLGHLRDELLRAVRLVVDTGIHSKKWSKKKAVHYMQKILGWSESAIITEVERYFVLPGQACAYKIGQLKILELRKRAKDSLKDNFDIREFHNIILKNGAVPLTILEEIIDEYIQKNLKKN